MHYLNLESISSQAMQKILEIDKSFVGTKDYMGLAYFWNYEYRHLLRDCTIRSRKKVHDKLLESGLSLEGFGEYHDFIVKRFAKGYQR